MYKAVADFHSIRIGSLRFAHGRNLYFYRQSPQGSRSDLTYRSSDAVLDRVHFALYTEIIKDTADVIVRANVVFSFD